MRQDGSRLRGLGLGGSSSASEEGPKPRRLSVVATLPSSATGTAEGVGGGGGLLLLGDWWDEKKVLRVALLVSWLASY